LVAFLFSLLQAVRSIRQALRDPEFRSILVLVLGQLGLGTVFYRQVERWSFLDSLYFSVITLATVGYGDFTPATAAGKIFTMFYIVFGIGLLVAFANKLAGTILVERQARLDVRRRRNDQGADPPAARLDDPHGDQQP
jgi:voltage-gated potassium channel